MQNKSKYTVLDISQNGDEYNAPYITDTFWPALRRHTSAFKVVMDDLSPSPPSYS